MVVGSLRLETDLAIIGGGPGGYVAAIRAADLGLDVTLIEERDQLGGVCLIEGCIPSKALINAVEVADAAREGAKFGINFTDVSVDLDKLRSFTSQTVQGLTEGVAGLLKRRGVQVVRGRATFDSNTSLSLEHSDVAGVDFKHAIIATGSRVRRLPYGKELGLWSSADALQVPEVPKRMVVVGGGYIGMELGLVYAALGSEITMVEFFPRLITGADADLVDVVVRHCTSKFSSILVESKVTDITKDGDVYNVTVEHEGKNKTIEADRVLVAIGREPNTDNIGLETTAITLDEHHQIPVDEHNRTVEPAIFAIGDVTPGPMLAHKASREGKVAAEIIAEHDAAFDNRAIPAVVFTDPEIAWAGLTEHEAKEKDIAVTVGKFPLRALGRARTMGRTDGLVKILADPDSGLVLGVGMVGPHASDMIAEAVLAIEMGATLEDLMVTIHPHPTISEAVMEAAEAAAGMPVHINPPKKAAS